MHERTEDRAVQCIGDITNNNCRAKELIEKELGKRKNERKDRQEERVNIIMLLAMICLSSYPNLAALVFSFFVPGSDLQM